MAIGCTIYEGRRPMDAHVGTFMEATLKLPAQHSEVVGQLWVRLLISALRFILLCHWLSTAALVDTQSALPMICLLTQDRAQALQDKQPGRDTWHTAVIGKEAFQLWEFRADMQGVCCQSKASALVHFSLERDSPGFQQFVRWLATDLRVGAQRLP